MLKNRLKRLLYQGGTAIGTFVSINSPDLVEIIGMSGFDFVVIDTEHGPLSIESTVGLIRAAELRGITPLTRITEGSEATILRSLDVGAYGIHVPQVNEAKLAKRIVQAAKYFPSGNRGVAMPRAADYGTLNPLEYFQEANEETMIVVHCENKQALDNLEEIAQVPEIDVIFLGPFDMSQSFGITGQINHPLIQEAAKQVLRAAQKNGKAAGIFALDGEQARLRAEEGFRYITLGMDVTLFAKVCKNEISDWRKTPMAHYGTIRE
ncbi:MAG: HpcH/HpaI aldolase family protein [Desulfitobacteriaceae bacterium]